MYTNVTFKEKKLEDKRMCCWNQHSISLCLAHWWSNYKVSAYDGSFLSYTPMKSDNWSIKSLNKLVVNGICKQNSSDKGRIQAGIWSQHSWWCFKTPSILIQFHTARTSDERKKWIHLMSPEIPGSLNSGLHDMTPIEGQTTNVVVVND